MSRLFDRAQSEYLQRENPVVTDYPFAMVCWFRSDDVASAQGLMFVGYKDIGDMYASMHARGDIVGDPIYAQDCHDGVQGNAITSSGYSADTWHHAAGMWLARTERHTYIDGGSKGSDFTSVSEISNFDRTAIGGLRDSSPGAYMSGNIAEAAVWNLTDWGDNAGQRETNP